MRLRNYGRSWGDWRPYSAAKSWNLTAGTGTKRVYYQLMDEAGNVSSVYSDTIVYDGTDPTVSVKINGGGAYTNSTDARLNISGSGTGSSLVKMRCKNYGGSWSAWRTYRRSRSWTLLAGDGTHLAVAVVESFDSASKKLEVITPFPDPLKVKGIYLSRTLSKGAL